MFSYVSLEQRVPTDHPLREVRKLTDTVLGSLSRELDALYADSGRPSIAPEYILRALLLQVFYSVRSDGCWSSRSITTCCFAGSWAWHGRWGVEPRGVFEEPRPAADVRSAQRFFAEVNRQAKKFSRTSTSPSTAR